MGRHSKSDRYFSLEKVKVKVIPTPTRLLWEAFSHAAYCIHIFHDRLQPCRYSFIQLNEVRRHGEKEYAQAPKQQETVAYPELVSRGVSKSRKFKWLVKVGACKDVNPLIKKNMAGGGVSGQPETPLDTPLGKRIRTRTLSIGRPAFYSELPRSTLRLCYAFC